MTRAEGWALALAASLSMWAALAWGVVLAVGAR